MSLFLNTVRQENGKAHINAGMERVVDAKRITSSCERCSLSVGIVSIRFKKPFGFSLIFPVTVGGMDGRTHGMLTRSWLPS